MARRGVVHYVQAKDFKRQTNVQQFGMSYQRPQASFDYRKELNDGLR
jgi:hypothetical protein